MREDPTTPKPLQRGPIFDDSMKILVDDNLAAVLSILGVHDPAQRLTTELAASTRNADLVVSTPAGGS